MPDISDAIVNGDNDYNEAVLLVNGKSFNDAMDKANSAGDNYNNSLNKLKNIQNKFSSDINDIQEDYIDIVIREFKDESKVTEYQISYRNITQVKDYIQTPKALEDIIDLNRQ